jgi:hypothetical protein
VTSPGALAELRREVGGLVASGNVVADRKLVEAAWSRVLIRHGVASWSPQAARRRWMQQSPTYVCDKEVCRPRGQHLRRLQLEVEKTTAAAERARQTVERRRAAAGLTTKIIAW